MTRVVGIALAVLIAISCSAPSASVLRVIRFAGIQPVPPFERSVQDAAAAQQLYDALVTLPVATNRWCAYGNETGYRLTFSDTRRLILIAKVESDGCREAVLPGNDRRATNESFWAIFADTLALDARNTDLIFPQPLVWYEQQQQLPKPRHPSLIGITCSCSSGSFRATTAMTGSS